MLNSINQDGGVNYNEAALMRTQQLMLESQNRNSTGNDLNVMSSDPDINDLNSGLRMVQTADGNTRFEKT
jgi:hypothetical protein